MVDTKPFVDGLGVLQALARQDPDLDGVNIFTRNPDFQRDQLPYVLITRVGGDSPRPEFQSSYFIHIQTWSGATEQYPDPAQAGFELSQTVARCFYRAKQEQRLAYDGDGHVMGWIAKWRESSGFQEIPDADLPLDVSRYYGVYDLIIRNRRPNSV
jgi:hypothetical protein